MQVSCSRWLLRRQGCAGRGVTGLKARHVAGRLIVSPPALLGVWGNRVLIVHRCPSKGLPYSCLTESERFATVICTTCLKAKVKHVSTIVQAGQCCKLLSHAPLPVVTFLRHFLLLGAGQHSAHGTPGNHCQPNPRSRGPHRGQVRPTHHQAWPGGHSQKLQLPRHRYSQRTALWIWIQCHLRQC